jgi:hypothetical protein
MVIGAIIHQLRYWWRRESYDRIQRRFEGKQRTKWDEWFYFFRQLRWGRGELINEWRRERE